MAKKRNIRSWKVSDYFDKNNQNNSNRSIPATNQVLDDTILNSFVKRFNEIKNKGYVKSYRSSDTGIGKTLESLLRIEENNDPGPDFGPIEIKSKRYYSVSYVTLFTQSPTYPKKINLLLKEKYGFPDSEFPHIKCLRTSFFTYFNTFKNKWGFRFRPDDSERRLYIEIKDLESDKIEDTLIYYDYSVLEERVNEKLNFLAFVQANRRKNNGVEEFKYTNCKLFYKCEFETFLELLKNDKVMYDIRMGVYRSGSNKGKKHDHGSAFRVKKENLPSFFKKTIDIT